ncbi:MAG: hypothetical protein A3F53_00920 [Candidatus Zambryskibacteria bacterium RIFCSPHIGHO2_12_FULL_48_10]|uniref:Phosphoglycerate mutase n=1 Tax=Candidatus Zambryskibacteria bacterium RIFCSPHIGHO2_01_FULL_46_25 TaxID=1802738 RepID=A0A1G2SYZ5_9BACT|nr:MAG: hypothetical protein UX71_C0003G0004 [Parcubacteria group bacterium GW2011_GWA1_47_10]OHA90223.1 MAG: hypothetical protein A2838_01300 [Candidatus Zambryskibacteria bacterium RIFCSPHIGHO2_01_FULL_46_25]OHB02622.1 MAG: hypothetical protein A3F53_00920 [Candidatus Zambryskibacteria bacterium RIFCSPHIGHO2_12_FULL_48_10]OHB06760.1 MAG: hypothetical protein A3A31_00435 [Candidatus Zambryskibacteria bacterium RIFCSPLOWO2_01_FULL_48_25]
MNTQDKMFFVMRHAESLEDIDKSAYERIADEDMPLSDKGKDQALSMGQSLIEHLGMCKHLHLILSPSKRVLETAGIMVSAMPTRIKWSLTTEHLIAKQNWGNVTIHNRSVIEKQRYLTGVLRYQFPGGENGTEMLNRFSLFAEKLQKRARDKSKGCTLVITHGFEFRVLLMSLLGWTEEYFESLAHPRHCELKRLSYRNGTFSLLDEMRVIDPTANPNFIQRQSSRR